MLEDAVTGTPRGLEIRRMFGAIHRTYDLLNHLLSLGLDHRWRRRTRALVSPGPGDRILDLCTGTADLALELDRQPGLVVGLDFTPEMLHRAAGKVARRRQRVQLVLGDALTLPFADGSFDVLTIAFGLRNLVDLDQGLAEMVRVARPGARVAVLEFSPPRGPLSRLLFGLVGLLLPLSGRLISGHGWAYSYLPSSIRDFPGRDHLQVRMEAAGLERVEVFPMVPDFVTVHLGHLGRSSAGGAP